MGDKNGVCENCGGPLYIGIGHPADYCQTAQLERKIRALELQLSEAKDTIMAEAMRAKMLNTVHQVALRQNTAMLELAEHYTGDLWPDEVQRAAKEILKAAKEATSEKPKSERECSCTTAWPTVNGSDCDFAEKRKEGS